jgi:hypothetical protein
VCIKYERKATSGLQHFGYMCRRQHEAVAIHKRAIAAYNQDLELLSAFKKLYKATSAYEDACSELQQAKAAVDEA